MSRAKGKKDTVLVSMKDLIRFFGTNGSVKVSRRWLESNGINIAPSPSEAIINELSTMNNNIQDKHESDVVRL